MTTRCHPMDERDRAEIARIKRAAYNLTVATLHFGAQCAAFGYLLQQLVPRIEKKPLTTTPEKDTP